MLAGIREQLIARRTELSNTIRGYAAEFGVTAAKGLDKIEPLLAQIAQEEDLPALARELFATEGREYARLQAELKAIEARLMAWHRANGCSRRLAQIPGGGTDRCHGAGDEDARSARVRLRPALCGLARADTERPFHCRQDQARQDHSRRRRGLAQAVGGGSDRGDPAGSERPWPSVALAACRAEAQATKTRGRGARQQDCPHRLEADDDGRKLRRRADAWRIGCRRLRDRPVGGFAAPVEPELQERSRW